MKGTPDYPVNVAQVCAKNILSGQISPAVHPTDTRLSGAHNLILAENMFAVRISPVRYVVNAGLPDERMNDFSEKIALWKNQSGACSGEYKDDFVQRSLLSRKISPVCYPR